MLTIYNSDDHQANVPKKSSFAAMEPDEKLRQKALDYLRNNTIDVSHFGTDPDSLLEELKILQLEQALLRDELQRTVQYLTESVTAARKAEQLLSKLFTSLPMASVILNTKGQILQANEIFCNRFADPHFRERIDYKSFSDFVVADLREMFSHYLETSLEEGANTGFETTLLNRDKQAENCFITIVSYVTQEELILSISEPVRSQESGTQKGAGETLPTTDQYDNSTVLTNICHALRAPILSILGFSEYLETDQALSTPQKKYVDGISRSGRDLRLLLDEALEISQLNNGELPSLKRATDIESLCATVEALFFRKFEENNILLRVDCTSVPNLRIDAFRLNLILFNLLEHALNVVKKGTVSLQLLFKKHADKESGDLFINLEGKDLLTRTALSDSSEENFEVKKAKEEKNSNLGFYMLKRTVKLMRGELLWKYPLNSLILRFNDLPVCTAISSEQENVVEDIEQPDMRLICLCVDDVVMNLKILDAQLQRMNIKTLFATSGKEALAILKNQDCDIVLTDLWMPEMTGTGLLHEIRKDPDLAKIPVIAITADVENEQNFEMKEFSRFILKPVNREKLFQTIQSLCEEDLQ